MTKSQDIPGLDPKALEAARAEARLIGMSGGEAMQVVRIVAAYLAAATKSEGAVTGNGWKFVPVEPTLSMSIAGEAEYTRQGLGVWSDFIAIYRAMLSAAPVKPVYVAQEVVQGWTPEKYAEQLAISTREKHYPEVPQFEPMSGDIMGLLSQIDNMLTGLVRSPAASPNPLPAAREEVGVTEATVEAALHAHVPGGAEVWHWLPQTDADNTDLAQPHPTARNVMRAALEAALRQAPAAPSQEAVPPQSLVAVDRRLQELALWLQGRMMFNEARDVDTARLALASPQGQPPIADNHKPEPIPALDDDEAYALMLDIRTIFNILPTSYAADIIKQAVNARFAMRTDPPEPIPATSGEG